MTLSTLNIAAQSADAAIEGEEKKLAQIIADEQNAQRELDNNHREIEQLRRTGEQISGYLAMKGRDRAAQEKKIRDAKAALNEQAEALIKTMAAFDLEPPQPAQVALPQDTQPDVLDGGDVPPTGQEVGYIEQVTQHGEAPAGLTQPFDAVKDTKTGQLVADHPGGNPVEPQEMQRISGSDTPSGAHQVARTGSQPSAEAPKGRGRR